MSTFVPVVIGVGDVVNRSLRLEDAKEPADLISQAVRNALHDTGLTESTSTSSLVKNIDSLSVVRTWTWEYPDLPGLLSTRLGIDPTYKIYSHNAGDRPTKYLDEAARRIATGQSKVAIVTGGEALASCMFLLFNNPSPSELTMCHSDCLGKGRFSATSKLDKDRIRD